ncbi:PhzF family phenazine biosynthesis protein [Chitinophaga agrisoli]|uniref:PhzF family phenazine biosynthesis protein n=1 Tax=Chitinophaga agrisoli TaxID=2607653 RepID=A0A5B2W2R0_9BACT|nr:PhzF family phenazine biosynthesis protein [Chitinophaga agrisoli]KAA2245374.1 PhzF family phenazine biosynthesis protein [Chitinophaga agrisoli]
MNIPFYQVDAFTKIPFKGNPAAVCIVDDTVTETMMQQIAAENNVSETAFVYRNEEGFQLRWFSPVVEVPLCGHATLATAHVLWEEGIVPKQETITFNTLSGWLSAAQHDGWIALNFPSLLGHQVPLPQEIRDILGVNPVNAMFILNRYLVELATEAEVRALTPDFSRLVNHPRIVVTAKGDPGSPFDFISRMFAPCVGINEDPVTGAAHCALAPYWAQQLGKQSMTAYQASARGGVVKVRQEGDRTVFSGEAVTVIKGTYTLNPSYATATLSN